MPASLSDSSSFHPPEFDCPTLQHLGVDASSIDSVSPQEQARKWLSAFEASVSSEDIDSLASLFHQYGFWRDILALTWDMRTIRGHVPIRRMLSARFAATGLQAFRILEDPIRGPTIDKPLPDLIFVRFCFEFETAHGNGIAIAFLVPTSNGAWTAWSLLTRLHALKAYPEKIGALRDPPSAVLRRREIDFADGDPTVLVIGAGHSGLEVAARLACLGVPTLVVDRNKRVGDNWRTRYKTLHLHDTKSFHRPGPFTALPQRSSAFILAALDLNIWLSSSIASATFSQDTRTWQVDVNRSGQTRRMIVKHLVFATGFGGGYPKIPSIPGKELYRGSVLHSTEYSSAADYEGKKVVIVGSGTSAHDIAHEFSCHGWDVTMIQHSPTYVISREAMEHSSGERYNDHFPTDFADVVGVAIPFSTLKHLLKASVALTASGIDKELLANLTTAGFQTYLGPDGAGLLPLIFERGGGFYIDTGASREIINGNIKVEGSPSLRRFTKEGVELEDKTVLEGDVVIFATGFGSLHDSIREVCGPDVSEKVGKIWGLDAEGEIQGVWKRTGHPRLWIAMANLGRSRFHSLHLALQIKAIEEGIVHDENIYIG